jgi:galactokinase
MNYLESLKSENEKAFRYEFGYAPSHTTVAPGRINIIGEHTDYNEGLSLAAGINRWVLVSIKPRLDKQVRVYSGNYHTTLEFELGTLLPDKEKWHRILSGLGILLQEKYDLAHGFDAYVWGNVPLGSGVSSSAAIEVALINAINEAFELNIPEKERVISCQQIEHHYMGVKSGLLDQYTSQFSKAGNLVLLDFRKVDHRYIAAELEEYEWILVNTMVHRELAGSKYSERVAETTEAFKILLDQIKEVQHFRDIKVDHLHVLSDKILFNRMKHYVEENDRVQNFILALQENQMVLAGQLLYSSHESLSALYEVSCEELDFLVGATRKMPECLGSRMMGGGFGGCTLNLVKKEGAKHFQEQISDVYLNQFGIVPEVNSYELVQGASTERVTVLENTP